MLYKNETYQVLKIIAICGDVIYILWMIYNGIDEGSHGIGSVQAVAISGLIILLILNIILLKRKT